LGSDIGTALRKLVVERARHRCEYCLLHEDDAYFSHQLDHIISRKHGGHSEPENLAYACFRCNAWKGSDIGSLDPRTGRMIPLFNPRRDRWSEHFEVRGFVIEPLTAIGEVTARLLKLNVDKRVAERQVLSALGRFPRPAKLSP
jgi:hypothetical protein